jgi:nucleoid-associated protein YgaU
MAPAPVEPVEEVAAVEPAPLAEELAPLPAPTLSEARAAADAPVPSRIMIERGDNLWRISRTIYGRGIRYTTIFQANQAQIRNPHWIYPGQVFLIPRLIQTDQAAD